MGAADFRRAGFVEAAGLRLAGFVFAAGLAEARLLVVAERLLLFAARAGLRVVERLTDWREPAFEDADLRRVADFAGFRAVARLRDLDEDFDLVLVRADWRPAFVRAVFTEPPRPRGE